MVSGAFWKSGFSNRELALSYFHLNHVAGPEAHLEQPVAREVQRGGTLIWQYVSLDKTGRPQY